MLQKHFFSSKFDVKSSSLLVLKLLSATVSFEIELSHSCLEHILILKQLNSKTQLQHIIEKLYIFAWVEHSVAKVSFKKVKSFDQFFVPMLTYGHECWMMTEKERSQAGLEKLQL